MARIRSSDDGKRLAFRSRKTPAIESEDRETRIVPEAHEDRRWGILRPTSERDPLDDADA
jgi:hypothetical protein